MLLSENAMEYETREPYKSFSEFICMNHPIFQHVTFHTRGNNTIDYIMSNNKNSITEVSFKPPIDTSDHGVITGNLNNVNHMASNKTYRITRTSKPSTTT